MKILVFSDVHGSVKALQQLVQCVHNEQPDKIVMCGDVFGWGADDKKRIADIFAGMPRPFYLIKGNNDSTEDEGVLGVSYMDKAIMHHFGRNLFFSHGHVYNTRRIPPILQYGDVLVYGHTHTGRLFNYCDLSVVNVPSVSRPRGCDSGYAILDEEGMYVKDLLGKTLDFAPYIK